MCWLVICLLTFGPPAGSAAGTLDQDRVDHLVRQLGSPVGADREEAENALSAGGPELLELLPTSTRDDAVSRVLARIRAALERSAARKAASASTVTLEGRRSPAEVEAAVLTQTSQAVLFGNQQRAPLDVHWRNTSLWDAVRQLELETKSVALGDRFADALVLRPRPEGAAESIVASSGPCRVEIVSVTRRPNLVDPSMALLQVRWRFRAEPRLRPLYLITADRDCVLTDGSTRYPPLSPDARREIPCERWQGCEVDTAFQVPNTFDVSKVQFSAEARLKVAALPLKLRFDDLQQAQPTPRRRGTVTGTVGKVHEDRPSRSLAFDITVAYDRSGPEFESHRMWVYQNAGWLEQKSSNRIVTPDFVDLKVIGSAGATLRYGFEDVPAALNDLVFVYEAPALVIDVPITVKDLELPVGQ